MDPDPAGDEYLIVPSKAAMDEMKAYPLVITAYWPCMKIAYPK
jgi:hypothetical protein